MIGAVELTTLLMAGLLHDASEFVRITFLTGILNDMIFRIQ